MRVNLCKLHSNKANKFELERHASTQWISIQRWYTKWLWIEIAYECAHTRHFQFITHKKLCSFARLLARALHYHLHHPTSPLSLSLSLFLYLCVSRSLLAVSTYGISSNKRTILCQIYLALNWNMKYIDELSSFTVWYWWIWKKKRPLDEQNFNKSAWTRREIKVIWNERKKQTLPNYDQMGKI